MKLRDRTEADIYIYTYIKPTRCRVRQRLWYFVIFAESKDTADSGTKDGSEKKRGRIRYFTRNSRVPINTNVLKAVQKHLPARPRLVRMRTRWFGRIAQLCDLCSMYDSTTLMEKSLKPQRKKKIKKTRFSTLI